MFLLTLLLLLFSTSIVFASDGTVTAAGYGATEAEALAEAKRTAVEEYVGTAISSDTVMVNGTVSLDRIYSKSEGYISSYEVTADYRDPRTNQYTVEIHATVSKTLDQDLMTELQQAKAVDNLQDPHLYVVVYQRGTEARSEAVETYFINALQKAGFNFVTNMVQDETTDYVVYANLSTIRTSIPKSPGFANFRRGEVDIVAKVYNPRTGYILCNFSGHGSAMSTNEYDAIRLASWNAVEIVLPQVLQSFAKKSTNPEQSMEIVVSNDRLGTATAAADFLKNLPGIASVKMRTSIGDTTRFDITYYGTIADIVAAFNAKQIRILSAASNRIEI